MITDSFRTSPRIIEHVNYLVHVGWRLYVSMRLVEGREKVSDIHVIKNRKRKTIGKKEIIKFLKKQWTIFHLNLIRIQGMGICCKCLVGHLNHLTPNGPKQSGTGQEAVSP